MYITFIYNTVLFLYILFRYYTYFTYTSEHILLTIGIVFNVFLGPDKHLEVFKCPVAVWLVRSEDIFRHIMAVTYCWQQINHPTQTTFNHWKCGKSNKTQLGVLCCGGFKGEGKFWFNFKFEIFNSGSEVKVAYTKFTVDPNFPSPSCGPLETLRGPGGWGHTAHAENH
jgi:hypothetical protein